MKNKLHIYLCRSWLMSLTLLLAISVSSFAQAQMKTDEQLGAEQSNRQALSSNDINVRQNANRPMAFPDPYCAISGFSTVEAITRVVFADMDNASAVGSTINHEDFTGVVANVSAGDTYSFALEGYTGGNFSNYVIVWADWNQDGVFDEATERYNIGVIANSTGADGIQVVGDIAVPADALPGQTRMRVMKRFGSTAGSATSCAGATSWGQAEDYTVEVGGGGGPFPAPYCEVSGFGTVEAITRVMIADIDNASDVSSTISHEDFTGVVGNVSAGDTYSFTLEGYTGGNFSNYVIVWADWNQDGVFDETTERYDIGVIANSTGLDGIQVTKDIVVPADALAGQTRMRVMKRFGTTPGTSTNSCAGSSSWGQAEDYTVEVGTGGGGPVYCTPEGTNANRYVDNFSTTGGTQDISNMGTGFSAGGYGDYYDTHTVAQEQGESVDFTADIEGGISGFRIWVDWNQDGIFDMTEEVAFASTGYEDTQTGTINVPVDALEGDTRMRIVSHWLSTTGNVDPCETGFTYGEFEDYKFTVSAGTSTGGDCSLATTGTFENGKSFTKNIGRIVANDITVPADKNMLLEKINLNAFIGGVGAGVNAADVDVYVYEDNGSGAPGAIHTTLTGIVPSSQTIIGDAFGFQAWDVEIDFAGIQLDGEAGASKTYWIGVSLEPTDGSNTFWEYSTAGVVGYAQAYDDGTGIGFIIEAGVEGVYTFHATCSDIGVVPSGGSITTIYDGGNNGAPGGAVYFDVTVGPEDIELTALDLNIDPGATSFTVEVYTIAGTYVGNETNQAAWTLQTQGSGTSAGEGNPSNTQLDDTFMLSANTTYGMALVMTSAHSHYYTNGDGTNEHFENADLSLDLGAASNVPFTAAIFSPRIFNGTLYYNVGGGTSGEDCGQGDDSNGFENGYNVTAGGSFRNADDFFVSADNTLNVRSIELNIFSVDPVASVSINFFEDDAGVPGATVVESVVGLVPYAQVPIGNNFGYTIYSVLVEVDLNFVGGPTGAAYWMQPEIDSPLAFWEVTSIGTLGELIHTSEDFGPWLPDEDGIHHGVFKLHCEVVDPTDPVCSFDISFAVEPITRVLMAGIDNVSSPVVDGSPALEDFTSIEGQMSQGEDYEVAFEGNTDGSWTNYFTVWIDWDQNGEWESDEMYEIGSITGSTGTDGQQATGTISVPADAVLGATTMRVIKSFGSSPTNPCGVYDFGQGEDYTIIVDDEVGIDDQSLTAFTYYPNPTSDVLNIVANREVSSVAVYNLLGQQVMAENRLDNGQIDVSALSTGTYMFRVMFEDGSLETFKVLKQ